MTSKTNWLKAAGLTAALGLVSASATADVIYSDNFNRANNSTVGNGWIETSDDPNDVAIASNTLRLRDNQLSTGFDAAVWQNLSTAGYTGITLQFDWRAHNNTEPHDTLNVSWRDSSADWTTIWSTGLGGSTFVTVLLDEIIGASDNASFELAFWTDVSTSKERVFLDNIALLGDRVSVPEPTTLGLFSIGLLGLGLSLKKKKQTTDTPTA